MARTPVDVLLRCRCGRVRGVAHEIAPTAGFRFVCYCKDCQAFSRMLDRPYVFDSAGGCDIFHMPAGHVTLNAGMDALRCISFSGKVLRWCADCCRAPLANTAATRRFPVVALIDAFMDHDAAGQSRDELLGPPLCRIYERSALGQLPPTSPPPASIGMLARRAAKLLGWWMRGLGRPNPFFDDRTGAPIAPPHIISPSERITL